MHVVERCDDRQEKLKSQRHRATRRLAANVVAALRIAERMGPGKTVATIIVDSGLRYVSTDVFRTEV
jgi:hypothetical protein